MAYRQLFAVACVAGGLFAVACGSGSGGAASGPPEDAEHLPAVPDDQASESGDRAPASSDRAPESQDRPAYSSDQPPGARPAPGGSGGAGAAACRAFCASVGGADGCEGNGGLNVLVRAVCGSGCVLDQDALACETEYAAAVNCLAGLDGLCTDDGPSTQEAQRCQMAFDAAERCDDADEPAVVPCTQAGGCRCGTDVCDTCHCSQGEDSALCDAVCE